MTIRIEIEQVIYDLCRTANTEAIEEVLGMLDAERPFERELREVVLMALRDRLGATNKIS
jgi:hypothetical protein